MRPNRPVTTSGNPVDLRRTVTAPLHAIEDGVRLELSDWNGHARFCLLDRVPPLKLTRQFS